ncbi:enoyl-CoA hydratase/isomerase family protein [Reichenbachiella versicolor]|uniref:enoyl-CoA hydratase/isomerase family protein n=1 Tax=Reichenbachiella versicolor TaxID=1821036 RepID=UPI000D6DDDEA|nr:enoyl-CoA hydratase-related protein [Reichenbachiella versicolor]
MSDYTTLLLDNHEGILTITINREKSLNSLNQQTLQDLKNILQEIDDDESVKGIILTGAGDKAFVAGADIKELAEVNQVNARGLAESGQEVFDIIERFSKPVIAAINGYTLGGGCELAMACHIRVATVASKFGLPEVSLGLIPGYGGTQRLTQLVGKGKAMEMILTGDIVTSDRALTFGLVNYLVPDPVALRQKCLDIMNKIISKAPMAISLAIDCINAVHTSGENGYQTEANSFGRLCGTDDFKEGTKAFIEKRTPTFTGK